ncbi:MAG TPA: isoprenyl transferase [Rickettsiales bacterium]|nr:isoprenyl transferase [Rickettsiales bacterium]
MIFSRKKKTVKMLDFKPVNHVAIIMDGNNRYAQAKNLPLQIGHKKGVENIEKIVDGAIEFGIKYLTLYAFSTENWNRPQDEVGYLMKLLDEYLEKETQILAKKNVKIVICGDIQKLSQNTQEKIVKIEKETAKNLALTLNVAFSYGARQEIANACKKIGLAVMENSLKIEEIDEEMVTKNLYQPQIPDPDLLIRTAGDLRISNFLLWQIAYTELYFTKKLWPEFSKEDLLEAIIDFNKRERRYGTR